MLNDYRKGIWYVIWVVSESNQVEYIASAILAMEARRIDQTIMI